MRILVTPKKTCIIVLQQLLLVVIVILQLRQTSFDLPFDDDYPDYPESQDDYPAEVRTQLITNEVYQPVEKVLKKLVSFELRPTLGYKNVCSSK